MPSGFHKSLVLARIPIIATGEVLPFGRIERRHMFPTWAEGGTIVHLAAIDALDNPPIAFNLIKACDVLNSVCVGGKAFAIVGVSWQALIAFPHALNHRGVIG